MDKDKQEEINELKFVSKEEYNKRHLEYEKRMTDIKFKLDLLGKDFDGFKSSFNDLESVVGEVYEMMRTLVHQHDMLDNHEDRLVKMEKSQRASVRWFWRTAYFTLILVIVKIIEALFHWNIDIDKILRLFLR